MTRFIALLLVALLAISTHALQFCALNPTMNKMTDLCFAVASAANHTTRRNDVALHIAARLTDRKGWAAVGVGESMGGALMFVVYPGAQWGDVTVSVRSTHDYEPPLTTEAQLKGAPIVHVTRTWVDGVDNNIYNAQLICYDCESWTGSKLDVDSEEQSWVWASHYVQEMGSDDVELALERHWDRGIVTLDMASTYVDDHKDAILVAQVTEPRITTAQDEKPAKKKHHRHHAFGLASIHGVLLTLAFMALSGGVLAIRSGIVPAFKTHWIVQSVAGGSIVAGCAMGIRLSFSHGGHFNTWHQIVGLLVGAGIVAQVGLGYRHHVTFVKFGRRTAVSTSHVWAGRALLVAGNANVALGLRLARASHTKFFLWLGCVCLQLALLLPMYYWLAKGRTLTHVLGRSTGNARAPSPEAEYAPVEQGAFVVDDEEDELDLDELEGKGGALRGR